MLDDLKEEGIVNKVGGRFKLSTLIQKRMVALNTGARPLVEVKGGYKMAIVIQEILQDKIYLDMSGQLQTRGASAGCCLTATGSLPRLRSRAKALVCLHSVLWCRWPRHSHVERPPSSKQTLYVSACPLP